MPEGGGGIPGAIAAAEILLRPGENDPIEVTTDAGGRFIADLAPGFYLVEVRAPGFDRLEGELIIPPLTEPIWLEKAKLIDPEESPESIRSRSGSVLIAGLAR
ncbi:MAG: carboxypeptidase-like regulatory domain-containing protein, partial [Planctomycetota bacterium]